MKLKTIQQNLTDSFEYFSDNIAISIGNRSISYGELKEMSDHIAEYLSAQGVRENDHVGIFLSDREKVIASIIAILKLKAVFIPLDTEYPEQRLVKMIKISDTHFLLTSHTAKFQAADSCKTVFWENINFEKSNLKLPVVDYSVDDKIYIYFTSGGTGNPNAVLGRNGSLSQFVEWEIETFAVDQEYKISQVTFSSHDPFLREMFVALFSGATLCIPPAKEIILSGIHLIKWLEDNQISLFHVTPSLFQLVNTKVLSERNFPDLKYVMLAGEKVVPSSLANWYRIFNCRIQLVNLYGPTETTLAKLYYLIQPEDVNRRIMPVGKPISGATVFIADDNLSLCGVHEKGEIMIRTAYDSFGYYNNLELTNSKWIKNPYLEDENDKIYRTGDYGCLLEDGNIEFHGRKDNQIKLRGQRIELDEIEAEIATYSEISNCCVVAKQQSAQMQSNKKVEKCIVCGLPANYPGVSLNEQGVCNVCVMYNDNKDAIDGYFRTLDDLKAHFTRKRKEKVSKYDCMLLFSGGKDSTYALMELVDMGLNVLAYSFDNGYISNTAMENIKRITDELDVDLYVDHYDDMNHVFAEGLKRECSVCNGCFKVLRNRSSQLAYEMKISSIVTGFSRGQICELRLEEPYQRGIFQVEEIEKQILNQREMYHTKNDYILNFLGIDRMVRRDMLETVELIDFYRYTDIKKDEIVTKIQKNLSEWNLPTDTGFCSSNCMINDVGIYMQREKYGYDNYTCSTSWEVRIGHINKQEMSDKDENNFEIERIQSILNKIGCETAITDKTNETRLIAYYTSKNDIDEELLCKELKSELPEYMLPSCYVKLDYMPMTANGKIDKNALPSPEQVQKKDIIAPRDAVEEKLHDIWCEILGLEKISIHDSFLNIGGNSLNVMALISRVYSEFEVELVLADLFQDASIAQIADIIRRNKPHAYRHIKPAEKMEYYPVSSVQYRMYTMEMMKRSGVSYNLPFALMMEGNINIKKIESVFQQIVERHEILRTTFHIKDNRVVQKVHDTWKAELDCIEISEDTIKYNIEKLIQPFVLDSLPLMRIKILKIKKDKYILFLDAHHVIMDGASFNIFIYEFNCLYNGQNPPLLFLQYKDYAVWQNQYLVSEDIRNKEKSLVDLYKDAGPFLKLPYDYEKVKKSRAHGDTLDFYFDNEMTKCIEKIAEENDMTIFMLLFATYNLFLYQLSGCEDIIIGVPVLGRQQVELENMLGAFINTIAVRNRINPIMSLSDYLKIVRENIINHLSYQDYPIERLMQHPDIKKQYNSKLIYSTLFTMQNFKTIPKAVNDVKFTPYKYNSKTNKFDLSLYAEYEEDSLHFWFEYDTKLFRQETIEQYSKQYAGILHRVLDDTSAGLDSFINTNK